MNAVRRTLIYTVTAFHSPAFAAGGASFERPTGITRPLTWSQLSAREGDAWHPGRASRRENGRGSGRTRSWLALQRCSAAARLSDGVPVQRDRIKSSRGDKGAATCSNGSSRANAADVPTGRKKINASVLGIVHVESCEDCSPSTRDGPITQFDTNRE